MQVWPHLGSNFTMVKILFSIKTKRFYLYASILTSCWFFQIVSTLANGRFINLTRSSEFNISSYSIHKQSFGIFLRIAMLNMYQNFKVILLEKGLNYKHRYIRWKECLIHTRSDCIILHCLDIFYNDFIKLILPFQLLHRWAIWPVGLWLNGRLFCGIFWNKSYDELN